MSSWLPYSVEREERKATDNMMQMIAAMQGFIVERNRLEQRVAAERRNYERFVVEDDSASAVECDLTIAELERNLRDVRRTIQRTENDIAVVSQTIARVKFNTSKTQAAQHTANIVTKTYVAGDADAVLEAAADVVGVGSAQHDKVSSGVRAAQERFARRRLQHLGVEANDDGESDDDDDDASKEREKANRKASA